MTMDIPGLRSKVHAKSGVRLISSSPKRLPTSRSQPANSNTLTERGASQALGSSGD
jgi:hypothetical protein